MSDATRVEVYRSSRGTGKALSELWERRDLIGMLAKRELKARYKDSTMGLAWVLVRPLVMLGIYWVAIGQFLGAATNTDDFVILLFAGLTAWQLFSEIVLTSTNSIVANGGLVKKIYVPREVFPLSATASAAFNALVQFGILVTATLTIARAPDLSKIHYFLLGIAVLLVYAVALGLLLSALTVYFRDVAHLVDVALLIGFWLSPIVYKWELVKDSDIMQNAPFLAELYLANPVTIGILGFREMMWSAGAPELDPDNLLARLGIMLGIGLVLLYLCHMAFSRLQKNFAQEL